MKIVFRTIHLYLGLAAGIVITIICFTGSLMVFEKELEAFIYPERYKVEVPVGGKKNSMDGLIHNLKKEVKGSLVSSVKVYSDPEKTTEINYTLKGEKKKTEAKEEIGKREKGKGKRETTYTAFMNPYSGEIITYYNKKNSFFSKVQFLHRWLLIEKPGKLIVGISVIIFVFILLTGIVLWWPKNRQLLKQRLTFKWPAGWKRVTNDLHIVLGFYSSIFLFVCAFTGLIMAFDWLSDGIFWLTGTESKKIEAPHSEYNEVAKKISWDELLGIVNKKMPKATYYVLNNIKDSVDAASVMVMPENALHEKATHQFYFDQYSGKLLRQQLFEERNSGQQIRSAIYPIHMGAIGGLPGRILAFLAALPDLLFPLPE